MVASGDDGVSSRGVRDSLSACKTSVPTWPAGCPYVTTIGATQLTTQFLPLFVDKEYDGVAVPISTPNTGETTCSASIGGVITSGGGFSNIYDRKDTAPWQVSLGRRHGLSCITSR
jgi:tripeptidyl-peptidase I